MEFKKTLTIILGMFFLIAFMGVIDAVKIDDKPVKEKYMDKTIIKYDGEYINGVKVKDKSVSSVYIDKFEEKIVKQKNGKQYTNKIYHVDSDHDFDKVNNESVYLEFYYTTQPDSIAHYTHSGKFDRHYFPTQWDWTPDCTGSGEDEVCSGGWVTIEVFNIEEGYGSSTFPISTTGPQWGYEGEFAGEFDGVDDYVEIPHDDSQLGANLANGFTISAWINPRSLGESNVGRILDKSTGTNANDGIRISIGASNTITFRLANGASYTSANNAIPFGTWTHVLFTATSPNVLKIYVNGTASGTTGASGNISAITTTNAMRIGNRAGATDSTFDGSIDEVLMFNRTLSPTEITNLYNNYTLTSSGPIRNNLPNSTGLVLDIDFDDYSVADLSGLGNHGTNTNVTFEEILADTITLVNGVDYTINLVSGLFSPISFSYTMINFFYNKLEHTTEDYIILNNTNSTTSYELNISNLTNALIYNTNGSIYGNSDISLNDGNINITLPPNNASYVLDNFNLTEGVTRTNSPLWISSNTLTYGATQDTRTYHIASNITDTLNFTFYSTQTCPASISYVSDSGTSYSTQFSCNGGLVEVNLINVEKANNSNVLSFFYNRGGSTGSSTGTTTQSPGVSENQTINQKEICDLVYDFIIEFYDQGNLTYELSDFDLLQMKTLLLPEKLEDYLTNYNKYCEEELPFVNYKPNLPVFSTTDKVIEIVRKTFLQTLKGDLKSIFIFFTVLFSLIWLINKYA